MSAPVFILDDGRHVIRQESSSYFARYRDQDKALITVSTGCRDESAAKQVLADLEKRVERIKSGILTPAEDAASEQQKRNVGHHLDAYVSTLTGSAMHRENTRSYLKRLVADCRWTRLADMRRGKFRGHHTYLTCLESSGDTRKFRGQKVPGTPYLSHLPCLTESSGDTIPISPALPERLGTASRILRRSRALAELGRRQSGLPNGRWPSPVSDCPRSTGRRQGDCRLPEGSGASGPPSVTSDALIQSADSEVLSVGQDQGLTTTSPTGPRNSISKRFKTSRPRMRSLPTKSACSRHGYCCPSSTAQIHRNNWRRRERQRGGCGTVVLPSQHR